MVPYSKMSSKGRIELRISQSRAKIDEEVAGDVRILRSSSKNVRKCQKNNFFPTMFAKKNFGVQTSGIVRNALSQSLVAVRAMFEG